MHAKPATQSSVSCRRAQITTTTTSSSLLKVWLHRKKIVVYMVQVFKYKQFRVYCFTALPTFHTTYPHKKLTHASILKQDRCKVSWWRKSSSNRDLKQKKSSCGSGKSWGQELFLLSLMKQDIKLYYPSTVSAEFFELDAEIVESYSDSCHTHTANDKQNDAISLQLKGTKAVVKSLQLQVTRVSLQYISFSLAFILPIFC